ncbi:hypothetical protein [Brucella endophytica]|nr:hypothetical protein [Brucella endophytica]
MRIEIKGKVPSDPRNRVLAIEAATRAICERAGADPSDGIMMLLTAAAHLVSQYSGKSAQDQITVLATALGSATVAADDFFKIRAVPAVLAQKEGE